ncbi:MAG: nucleotidyl transferase AbiEii/AbiGii toxin family protein [Candidatus Omnitrophica bacterium]|nr:nucleotidyl transferase AbiEii/AbiGii toxin family protein [Candidatus Omnitrophota bacterium]
MDNFLLLRDEDKKVYFDVVAHELDVTPQLIEKDFWVCWILRILFALPEVGGHLTFKGGTSLSKCYDVIKRFSEDVDISIERSYLAPGSKIEPDKGESNKENQKRLKELHDVCKKKIGDVVLPELKQAIAKVLPDVGKWSIELDPDDPHGQTLLFVFPHAMTINTANYIRSSVKIEMGARADHWPIENAMVVPYVAHVSALKGMQGAAVRVLAAERTFWEKATILHMIYHYEEGKGVPLRMSRHYYDIFAMARSPIYERALTQIALLKQVAEHKILFFKANWAHYDQATPGSLRLLPRQDQMSLLKNDYRQMNQMFFEEPPSFEEIMEKLQEVEERINNVGVEGR